MPESFRIVLRDAEGFEGLDSRRFDLAVGASFPIGRASRNSTKKELMPAEHNAYIDSPVISRDHAVLSASTHNDVPKVFITDSNSMHGTTVNGQKLAANTPKELLSGDTLQFGIDVNRNEEFYVARKYTFEAELMQPQAPFSVGFTVPEPESEEEEIFTDSESDASDIEELETTILGAGFIVDVDDDSAAVCGSDLTREPCGDSSEDEESLGDYPDEIEDDIDEGLDSQASLMGDSVVNYNSDMDLPDVDIDEDVTDLVVQQTVAKSERVAHEPSAHALPLWKDMAAPFNPMQTYAGSLPPMMMTDDQGMTSFAPPLPPRPSAARPPIFDRSEPPFSQKPNWLSDDGNAFSNFLGTNHGDRPSLFSPAPVSTMAPAQEAENASSVFGNSANFAPINSSRMQTPPPMPFSDVTTTTPPPPSRRTKVSITEIVEEQPPTPTSVNEMKRKADVLEEEETPTPDEKITILIETESTAQSSVDAAQVQTADIIAQRPKKQPRSILKKLRNTATYLGYGAAGAAGAVALLTYLPDSFFV